MLAEDCVLCSSGYTANVGLIQSFAAKRQPRLSRHEGAHLAARGRYERWRDPGRRSATTIAQSLDRMLAQTGPGLVAVDALYSTDGDIAPLAELVEVCERHGAALIVDETHSFGTQGPGGAGLVVAAGLAERVHFRTVGLSKAVASRGGIIVCSRRNTEYFRYEVAAHHFQHLGYAARGGRLFDAVLDIFEREDWRRTSCTPTMPT